MKIQVLYQGVLIFFWTQNPNSVTTAASNTEISACVFQPSNYSFPLGIFGCFPMQTQFMVQPSI